jgi:epoxyqueuosine reductase
MNAIQISKNSQMIRRKALELGFDYCGIAKAEFLEEEAPRLEMWLNKQMHGKMAYMENYFDKRLDPRKLVEGAQSVISLLLNYFPEETLDTPQYKISKYAYGKDYHVVLKKKLHDLLDYIRTEIGDINGRAFVDSAPVMDKAWAKKSGNGWIGKNANLINKNSGSFFFLAELIVDLPLEYDGPVKDYCGTCTRCIDACPTTAITEPYVVDGSKCISYLTIELKEQIPDSYKGQMADWIFGCDVCQDVCPWNSFSKPHNIPEFQLNAQLKDMNTPSWEELSHELFNVLFKNSAVKRTKYKGLKRNIEFIKQISSQTD